MGNILFFDVETSGLPPFGREDPIDQTIGRVCQLAAILTGPDGEHIEAMNHFIKPDGWVIPPETTAIHGITTEHCDQHGIPMIDALTRFNEMKEKATDRAAYNINFDKRLMAREAEILGVPHSSEGIATHCVMQMASPICKMAPTYKMLAANRKGFKSPKLQEAYTLIFGQPFDGAHDAMSDVIATIALFFKIKEIEREKQPILPELEIDLFKTGAA